uniref:G_PROTEIN_RECEP_F1_2 domain-containing protein n=1 Tax=Panagrellus redivivus TaxID=6233 RepID=A0A7E4UYJ5_PANRE
MTTSIEYIQIDDGRIAEFVPDAVMYRINTYVALTSMVIVLLNLTLLVTNKNFAKMYKVLIALNIMDCIVLMGIFLEAKTRQATFAEITLTRKAKVVSSRDCIELWTVVQVYADFGMPLIEFVMGIERFTAVMFPSFYRSRFHKTTFKLILLVPFFAALATVIPTTMTILWPESNVRYLCGRKAAFGTIFGVIDYAFNVVMISTALILNVTTCIKAMAIQQSRSSMRKIKCYTGIAVVSTVLVSVPNLFSILNATWVPLPDALMTPAPILACVNCSLQFFINLTMNDEYRARFFRVVTIGKFKFSGSAAQVTTISSGYKMKVMKTVTIQISSSRSFVK